MKDDNQGGTPFTRWSERKKKELKELMRKLRDGAIKPKEEEGEERWNEMHEYTSKRKNNLVGGHEVYIGSHKVAVPETAEQADEIEDRIQAALKEILDDIEERMHTIEEAALDCGHCGSAMTFMNSDGDVDCIKCLCVTTTTQEEYEEYLERKRGDN